MPSTSHLTLPISAPGGCIWNHNAPSHDCKSVSDLHITLEGSDVFCAITLSVDGSMAAALAASGELWVFYLSGNRFVRAGRIAPGSIQCGVLCFVPDRDELLVSAGSGVNIIGLKPERTIRGLSGHRHPVTSADARPGSANVLTASSDVVILWDSSRWKALRYINAGTTQIVSACLGRAYEDIAGVLAGDGLIRLCSMQGQLEEEILLPTLNGMPCVPKQLVLGQLSFLALAHATDVDSGVGTCGKSVLLCWKLGSPACKHPLNWVARSCCDIQQIQLQQVRWKGCTREVVLILHSQGVDALDLSSWQCLFSSMSQDGVVKAFSTKDGHLCGDLIGNPIAMLLSAAGGLQLQQLESPHKCIPRGSRHAVKPAVVAGRPQRHLQQKLQQQRRKDQPLLSVVPPERLTQRSIAASKGQWPQELPVASLVPPTPQRRSPTVVDDLVTLLNAKGMLPDRLRPLAWQKMLGLPGNLEAHRSLVARGRHPAYVNLSDKFPGRGTAGQRLSGTLSVLAHWSSVMAELLYLPVLVFPLIQVFQADHLLTFEFVATFFMNWGRDWLEFFPNPPIGSLSRAAAMLEAADPELYLHLGACVCDADADNNSIALSIFWPLLQTLLSEVLSKSDWLALWDFLVARWKDAELLVACSVALLLHRRCILLALPKGAPHCLDQELRRCRTCSPRDLLKRADNLLKESTAHWESKPCFALEGTASDNPKHCESTAMLPLSQGLSYPILQRPASVVNYHALELSQIQAKYSTADVESLTRRLDETKSKLEESSQQLAIQSVELSEQCKAQHARVLANDENLANKHHEAHNAAMRLQFECTEQLGRGADAALQRQQAAHDYDVSRLKNELEIRQERRGNDVAKMSESQITVDQEHHAIQELTDKLQVHRGKAEHEHVQKLADLCSIECDVLGKLRMQQLITHEGCIHKHQEANVMEKQGSDHIKASAKMRRELEAELSLQGVFKELELGRHLSQSNYNCAKTLTEAFEDDTLQMQQQRQRLSTAADHRVLEEEELQWETAELQDAWHRQSAELHNQHKERALRRSAQEEVLLARIRRDAESRLRKTIAQDAAEAAEDEGEFRETLLGLDELCRRRKTEQTQLVWE